MTATRAALPIRMVPARLRGAVAAWAGAEAGVAAVEFALVLPVMVTMLLGLSEVTLAVNVDRKVTLLSRSLADLSSRAQSLTTSDLDDVFKAATIVMQPFDPSKLKMTVTQMKVTKVGSNYQGTVDWSCARGPGAQTKAPSVIYTVPTGFQNDGTYYMQIDTGLPYTPIFGKTITGTLNLAENTPWPIRNNNKVTLSGGCPSST